MSHGFEVKWSGDTKLEVLLVESMKGKVCGLCGNYDDKRGNDWRVGPAMTCLTKDAPGPGSKVNQ